MLPDTVLLIGQKLVEKAKKWSNLASSNNAMLPDTVLLKGQKLVENAKIRKFSHQNLE